MAGLVKDAFEDYQPKTGLVKDAFETESLPSKIVTTVGDAAITGLKSAINVPETAIGLADIVTAGRAGRASEGLGFRPKEAKAALDEMYSPEQKAKIQDVRSADGFLPTLGAYTRNPTVLAHDIGEQVFPILGGGLIARGIGAAAPALTKTAPYLPGAIGEGIVTAGQNVEQVRQETPGGLLDPVKQVLPVAASGLATGAIAAGSGKLADKLGLSDIQRLAAGITEPTQGAKPGIMKNIAGTALLEGAGQELPQSFQEQVAQNYALDKPLLEGAGTAAAQGLALGTAMGGGAAIASGPLSNALNKANVGQEVNQSAATTDQRIIGGSVEPENTSRVPDDADAQQRTRTSADTAAEQGAADIRQPLTPQENQLDKNGRKATQPQPEAQRENPYPAAPDLQAQPETTQASPVVAADSQPDTIAPFSPEWAATQSDNDLGAWAKQKITKQQRKVINDERRKRYNERQNIATKGNVTNAPANTQQPETLKAEPVAMQDAAQQPLEMAADIQSANVGLQRNEPGAVSAEVGESQGVEQSATNEAPEKGVTPQFTPTHEYGGELLADNGDGTFTDAGGATVEATGYEVPLNKVSNARPNNQANLNTTVANASAMDDSGTGSAGQTAAESKPPILDSSAPGEFRDNPALADTPPTGATDAKAENADETGQKTQEVLTDAPSTGGAVNRQLVNTNKEYQFPDKTHALKWLKANKINNAKGRVIDAQGLYSVEFDPSAQNHTAPISWFLDADDRPVKLSQDSDLTGYRGPYTRRQMINVMDMTDAEFNAYERNAQKSEKNVVTPKDGETSSEIPSAKESIADKPTKAQTAADSDVQAPVTKDEQAEKVGGVDNKKPASEDAKVSDAGRVNTMLTQDNGITAIKIRDKLVNSDVAGREILDEYGIAVTAEPHQDGTTKIALNSKHATQSFTTLIRELRKSGNDVLAGATQDQLVLYARPKQVDSAERLSDTQAADSATQNPQYEYISPAKLAKLGDSMIDGELGSIEVFKKYKDAKYKEIQRLRERIKNEPLNGNRQGLRLDLLKAEDRHKEYLREESSLRSAIEKRANQLGYTTQKPVKPSTATTTRNTYATAQDFRQAMTTALDKQFGRNFTAALMNTGMVKIIANSDISGIVKDAPAGRINAFFDPATKSTYFVHDNIGQDAKIANLAAHEIGVHALSLNKDSAGFKSILKQVERLRDSGDKAVIDAFSRVPKNTPEDLLTEEALGYLTEFHSELPIVRRFLSWLRAQIRNLATKLPAIHRSKFARWANELQTDDLIYIAREALRSAPQMLGNEQTVNTSASRETFKAYDNLGVTPGTAAQSLEDAKRITGLHLPINAVYKDLPVGVPMRFNAKTREVEVSASIRETRGKMAQYMTEELLHAVDVLNSSRTLSASSDRLDLRSGDIAQEIINHFTSSGIYRDFFSYPLMHDLTKSEMQAELFARLGVLYFGEAQNMRQSLPIAYEAYHGLFRYSFPRPSDSEAVRGKIWFTPGGFSEVRGRQRGIGQVDGGDKTRTGNEQANIELGRLRDSIAQVFKSDRRGGLVQGSQRYSIATPTADEAFSDVEIADTETWAKQAKYQLDKLSDSVFKQKYALLSVKQMAEIAKQYAPGLKDFARLLSQREAIAGDYMRRGDRLIDEKWKKLSDKDRRYLSYVINQSTLNDVDATKAWHGVEKTDSGYAAWTQNKITHKSLLKLKERYKADGIQGNTLLFNDKAKADRIASVLGAYRIKAKSNAERKNAHADLQRKLNALGDAAKSVYSDASKLHNDLFQARLDALMKNIDEAVMDGNQRTQLKNAIRLQFESNQLDWYYAPLSRFGRYWVYADKNGERIFKTFEVENGRDAYVKTLQNDKYTIIGKGTSLDKLHEMQMDGTNSEFVKEVQGMISDKLGPESARELQDMIYQMYLETLPDVSMRKNSIHRKGTQGFEEDALRSFANAIHHSAKQLATLRIAPKMQDNLELHKQALDAASSKNKRNDIIDESAAAAQLQTKWISLQEAELGSTDSDIRQLRKRFPTLDAAAGKEAMQRIIDRNNQILEIAENIGPDNITKMADILNELSLSFEAMNKGSSSAMDRIAIGINQLNFFGMMGFNISSMFMNTLQTPIVAMPVAAAKYGYADTTREFTKAYGEFIQAVKSGSKDEDGNLSITTQIQNGDELKAMEEFKKFDISRTQAFDLIGIGEQGENHGGLLHDISKKAGWIFHHSERMNREITLLSTYRLARQAGKSHADAIEAARDLNDRTHLDYASENAARIFRGPIARISLQFKKYTQGMYFLWGKTLYDAAQKPDRSAFKSDAKYNAALDQRREAVRTALGLLAAQASFAGMMGVPMMGMVMAVANMIGGLFDDDDDPWDTEKEIRLGLHKLIGPTAAEILSKGIANTLTDVDFASRMDLSDIFFRPEQRDLEGRDAAEKYLVALFGPTGGSVGKLAQSFKFMDDGQWARAAEQLLPGFLSNILKGIRYSNEDAKSLQGVTLKDMTAMESFLQTMGFSSAELSKKYDERNYVMNEQNAINDAYSKLLNKAAEARINKEALPTDEIRDWNKKHPEKRLTMANIMRSIRTRKRQERERGDRGYNINKRLRYLEDENSLDAK